MQDLYFTMVVSDLVAFANDLTVLSLKTQASLGFQWLSHVSAFVFQEDPLQFYGATISGSFALILTLSMCIRQSHVLNGRPLCMQRGYYRGMLLDAA
jgi:hypothetical protein